MDDNDYIDISAAVDEINRRDREANNIRQQDVASDIYSDEFMRKVEAKWGPLNSTPKGIRGVIDGLKHSSREERSDIISSVIIIGVVIVVIVVLLKWIF